jgi:hypothetical protein
MRDTLLSLAVGGFAMVAVGSASATTINVPTSFGAGADALVNLGTSSNVNKGGIVNAGVQNVSKAPNNQDDLNSPFTARSILRFDLSDLPVGTITDAYFTFSVRFLDVITASIYGLDDTDPQDAVVGSGGFEEDLITADNAPLLKSSTMTGFNTRVGTESFTQTVGLTTTNSFPTFVTFTLALGPLKNTLVNFLNADTNDLVSFMMVSDVPPKLTNAPGFGFWTKEGQDDQIAAAVAPTLTITVAPSVVPVPAALPLILTGLAGVGLMGWRQRKAA